MCESERFGVQGLSRKRLKHVPQEGVVLAARRSLDRHVASVDGVTEQRMSDVLHVNSDLMRPTRFQLAFHQGYRSQALQHTVMRHGVFAFSAILEHLLNAPVTERAPHVTRDGAILADIPQTKAQ